MAFTRAHTFPALYGGPGPASAPLAESATVTDTLSVSLTDVASLLMSVAISVTDTLSVSITDTASIVTAEVDAYKTQIGLYGGPAPYVSIADKSAVTIFNLDVSDTLLVQIIEEPVDEQQIVTGDTLRVSLTETRSLFNNLSVTDTLNVGISETIALVIAGVVDKPVTDTLSVSVTESISLGVSVDVTDTLSVSLTDTSSVDTPTVAVDVTDTLSVSLSETALLEVFVGTREVDVADVLRISISESATVIRDTPPVADGPVESMRFEFRSPSMRFEFL